MAMLVLRDSVAAEVPTTAGRLFVGSIGAAYSEEEVLRRRQYTHVVCVGMADAMELRFAERGLAYLRVPVRDRPTEPLGAHLPATCRFIEAALAGAPANKVLVHCFQGKSRSVAVAAAFLMRRDGLSLEQAVALIRTTRPAACPNVGFAAQLLLFSKTLLPKAHAEVDDEHHDELHDIDEDHEPDDAAATEDDTA